GELGVYYRGHDYAVECALTEDPEPAINEVYSISNMFTDRQFSPESRFGKAILKQIDADQLRQVFEDMDELVDGVDPDVEVRYQVERARQEIHEAFGGDYNPYQELDEPI
ncbi:MAG TPA: hypothetical protein VMQ58_00915, partial [Candidatus Saccharimonadales bacterium]|nr:hypothetical protein [Candidatus Saccharimonadales bacterium]